VSEISATLASLSLLLLCSWRCIFCQFSAECVMQLQSAAILHASPSRISGASLCLGRF
jgi:hypothetical protein